MSNGLVMAGALRQLYQLVEPHARGGGRTLRFRLATVNPLDFRSIAGDARLGGLPPGRIGQAAAVLNVIDAIRDRREFDQETLVGQDDALVNVHAESNRAGA